MDTFHAGLAEILEIDASEVVADLDLTQQAWDSLAVVSTIALIDELFDVMISGRQLAGCRTVADIDSLIRESRRASV
jgi:acyl carrier protein